MINAVHTRAELTEDFSQAIQLGAVMAYAKATFGKVLWKNITFSFLAFGVMLLGLMLCYIGMYPAMALLQIASLHLRRQVYAWYLGQGGEPIPLKDPQLLQSEAQVAGPYGYG